MSVNEYGARVLRPEERLAIYEARRGESLTKIALGIKVKQRWLERFNMIPKHRALVAVQPVEEASNEQDLFRS